MAFDFHQLFIEFIFLLRICETKNNSSMRLFTGSFGSCKNEFICILDIGYWLLVLVVPHINNVDIKTVKRHLFFACHLFWKSEWLRQAKGDLGNPIYSVQQRLCRKRILFLFVCSSFDWKRLERLLPLELLIFIITMFGIRDSNVEWLEFELRREWKRTNLITDCNNKWKFMYGCGSKL